MNNKIKTIIIAIIATMLLFSTLVSCDSGVITTKNKDYAYTEILETNGVFEYNGQYYDSLSDAIKAIENSGEDGTIKLIGDAASRAVTITEGTNITIDLGGHELKFFDVKDSAVKALAGANLTVSNGTLSLTSTDKSLSVLNAEGTDAEALLHADVTVKGPVSVSDGAKLFAANYLEDVRMYGATLIIEGSGMSVVTVNEGDNEYDVSPDGELKDETQSIVPDQVHNGYWFIERGNHYYFYGSLEEAIASLEPEDTTLVLIGNETTTPAVEITLDQSIILYLQEFTTGTNNIKLTGGEDLTITGTAGSRFIGTITSEGEENSKLTVTGVAFNCSVEVDGDVSLTNVGGSTELPITSTNGSITIDNSAAGTNFGAGAITAKDAVVLKGYYDPFGVGEVKAASLTATSITGIGNVDVSGDLVSAGSSFVGTVKASTVTDGSSTTIGSIFKGNITASRDINLTCSTFNSGTETAPSVTSANGDINLTKASGTAGAITANGEDGSGNVSIDNSNSTITDPFKTGDVTAKDKVDIKGKEGNLTVDISGNVYADEISIKNSHIMANAVANGKTGDEYTPASSVTIENPINASGPSFSYIGNLYADELSVSATSAGSTLEVVNAVVSGNTESEINAAYFYNLTHTGEGDLTINGGYFENFVYSDASGNNNLNGGIFIVKGSSTDNGFNTINDLLELVTETGDVTIFSEPCADSSSSFTFVELPESFIFTGLVGGAKATLNFSYGHLGGSTLYGGWIATSAKSFTFDDGITIGESECRMFVTYGNTITSSKDLNDSTAQRVYKLTITTEDETSVYKYSENVYETESSGAYIYSPKFEIVFNTVGLEDGTNVSVSKAFDEYSSITIPSASDLGDDFETDTQKIDGWSASNATDRTKEFDAEATVTTFTANDDGTNLYAVWKTKGATITFSNTSNYISAITIGSDTYESNGTKAYESDKTFASQGGLATVTLTDTSYAFVGWFTGTNGTGTRYNDSMEVTDDMGTLTLYPCVRDLETSGTVGDMIVAYAPIYSNTQNAAAISTQSVESTVKQNRRFYYVIGDSSFSFFVYEDLVVSQQSKYIVLRVEDGSSGMTKAEMEITGLSAINAIAQANNVSVLKTSDGYYFHCSDAGGYIDTDSSGATGKMVWQPFSKLWNNPYETVSE